VGFLGILSFVVKLIKCSLEDIDVARAFSAASRFNHIETASFLLLNIKSDKIKIYVVKQLPIVTANALELYDKIKAGEIKDYDSYLNSAFPEKVVDIIDDYLVNSDTKSEEKEDNIATNLVRSAIQRERKIVEEKNLK